MADKLKQLQINAVALADMGANYDPETGEGAHILLLKRAELYWKKKYTAEQRRKLAAEGKAMPDGSFPIVDAEDLSNAVGLWGNANNPAAAKKFIIRRARALGLTSRLPDSWGVGKGGSDMADDSMFRRFIQTLGKALGWSEEDVAKAVEELEPEPTDKATGKCPACGASNPPGATKCVKCGAAMKKEDGMDKSALTDEQRQAFEDLEKRATEAEDRATKAEDEAKTLKAAQAAPAPDDSITDPVEKALADPDVPEVMKSALRAERDARKAAEKEAADEREVAKTERERIRKAEFVTKAEALKALPVEADKFGPVLMAVADGVDAETFGEVERVLRAADEGMRQSELFGEKGRSGAGGEGSAYATATAKAEELRKADPKLTIEQARTKVFDEDKELYARYRRGE